MKCKTVMAILTLMVIVAVVSGCDENQVAELDAQISDPNSILQVTADQVQDAIIPLQILIKALPIPHAATISAILAAVGWALGIIKSLQKKKSDVARAEADTSLREVVVGLEDAKKRSSDNGNIERNELRKALSEAESVSTRKKIAVIRKELSKVA